MGDLPNNVALVYDRVNKWGGAEQILLALHELFPASPLYTSVYQPDTAPWAKVFSGVLPAFLQNFPLARTHHELYPWLTPLAFESLDFRGFDAVISVTSADAKSVITGPGTFHLCYCLTPTRYLWVHPAVPRPLTDYLKYHDLVASRRPDAYLAISGCVRDRIRRFYNQDSTVVYPPVNIEKFVSLADNAQSTADNYFLWVGRLVYHKQPDLLIRVFNELGLPLVIAGTGRMEGRLRRLARSNIRFTGFISPEKLVRLYQQARAFVSVHEEDFGISFVEAQAAGLPVIALNRGAVGEIVTSGRTGILAPSLEEFKSAVVNFDKSAYDPRLLASSAARFSAGRFAADFAKVFRREWTKFQNTSMS